MRRAKALLRYVGPPALALPLSTADGKTIRGRGLAIVDGKILVLDKTRAVLLGCVRSGTADSRETS